MKNIFSPNEKKVIDILALFVGILPSQLFLTYDQSLSRSIYINAY